MLRSVVLCGLVASMASFLGGCAYETPRRGADLSAIGYDKDALAQTDAGVASALAKKPLAQFPTAIAVARIESPNYRSGLPSQRTEGWGQGRYSIVTERDIEDPAVLDAWKKMPGVLGIAPLNRMLLPTDLESDRELRRAAAELHADLLLVYTIDTTFTQEDILAPLTLVTLGIAPNQKIVVSSTASAVLMDTRNGYIYAVAEATHHQNGLTMAWGSEAAIDQTRRDAESQAFKDMAGQLASIWGGVVKHYQTPEKTIQ